MLCGQRIYSSYGDDYYKTPRREENFIQYLLRISYLFVSFRSGRGDFCTGWAFCICWGSVLCSIRNEGWFFDSNMIFQVVFFISFLFGLFLFVIVLCIETYEFRKYLRTKCSISGTFYFLLGSWTPLK